MKKSKALIEKIIKKAYPCYSKEGFDRLNMLYSEMFLYSKPEEDEAIVCELAEYEHILWLKGRKNFSCLLIHLKR